MTSVHHTDVLMTALDASPTDLWSTFFGPMTAAVGSGFRHIVPDGPDHIAFLLGLFFLSRQLWPLLWQITLFTVAHSLALGLILYGLPAIPPRMIETAVALSIAFIAIENLFSEKPGRWRPWVVFVFGWIHGLAFAHTFSDRPLTRGEIIPSLFGFNLGVELGQLVVIGSALLVFGGAWDQPWYRHRVAIPASVVIALSGLGWAIQRSSMP